MTGSTSTRPTPRRSPGSARQLYVITTPPYLLRLCRGSWRPGDPEPTFPEFVRFLISTEVDTYDEHWQPVASRCRCVPQLEHSNHRPLTHYTAGCAR